MPELPDVKLYVAALTRLLSDATLKKLLLKSPFVLRTIEPDYETLVDRRIEGFSHCGKRIVWHLCGGPFLVFHPMIAGRFHWRTGDRWPRGKNDLMAILTNRGTMMFTEASPKKRAGLWIVSTLEEVMAMDPGGIDLLFADPDDFRHRLLLANNTLKRALTDPTRFCGIGNAYSDEILHRARLSPLQRVNNLSEQEIERLFHSARDCLTEWISRLSDQWGDRFPEKVTAFHREMAVHGRFQLPCPDCGHPVQRIRYAENECNYCAACQTGGRLLADRSLSRLLRDDWPRSIDELE
jgi:formamidopyrimidine-DNA glycosylase